MTLEQPTEIGQISVDDTQPVIRHLDGLNLDVADFDEVFEKVKRQARDCNYRGCDEPDHTTAGLSRKEVDGKTSK
jgi:hypothetical protein